MSPLDGYKTIIAALGLVGVGVYLNYTGQIDGARLIQLVFEAAMVLGVRDAIRRK